MDFYFVFFIFQGSTLNLKKKLLLGKVFGSPYTSNRIYLLQSCFASYVHFKDMYIILNGISQILFVSGIKNFANL